jgi:uncharacterized membrane protein
MMIGLPFLAVAILGAVCLISALVRRSASSGAAQGEDALQILKRRYAAGEINAEEFARVKKDVQQ